MKKISILIVSTILLVLFFTAPKQNDFKQQLKDIVKNKIEYNNVMRKVDTTEYGSLNDAAYESGSALGYKIAESAIEKNTNVKNYLFFSVAYYNDNKIGYGLLGTTFIDNDIAEKQTY